MKQADKILQHLNEYGNISSLVAFRNYRITRLSAVIYDLRKRGIKIDSVPLSYPNNDGTVSTYAMYTLTGVAGDMQVFGKEHPQMELSL